MASPWWRYTWHTTLGLGALAFSVAATLAAILRLVDIGTCVSHPVLVSTRPCPDGVGALIVLAGSVPFLGMIGWAVYATRLDRRRPSAFDEGPDWSLWWWPGLFLGGAFAFARAADTFRAGGDTGSAVAMWATGAVFVLMGVAPLVFGWRGLARRTFGGPPPPAPEGLLGALQTLNPAAVAAHAITTAAAAAREAEARQAAAAERRAARTASSADAAAADGPFAATGTPSADPQDDDLVSALERLSALHRAGQLDDGEFARAKAQVLRRARAAGG